MGSRTFRRLRDAAINVCVGGAHGLLSTERAGEYFRPSALTTLIVPATVSIVIRPLTDMAPGVLGFEAVGDVERDDYRDVLVPAIEGAIAEHGKVRMVYVLGPEFDEYEGGAGWEDFKLGVSRPAAFERVAVVTDAKWAGPALKALSVLWPGQMRAFTLADLESAKRWAADEAT